MIRTRSAAALILFFILGACSHSPEKGGQPAGTHPEDPFLLVLGTVQDGGSPHPGCVRPCCRELYHRPDNGRCITSLGLSDPATNKTWLIEASPDLPQQLYELNAAAGRDSVQQPDGIFISHAHIGHYAGLMYLGREAMSTRGTVVYAMPRLRNFLENNGPWSQLLTLKNIVLAPLENEQPVNVSASISITPFLVPHRDEFSETVGFLIRGPSKKVLFIPDIDKWKKWDKRIEDEIARVDLALIDGTFYDGREIGHRDLSEIPHPFVTETMALFNNLSRAEKEKIHFIHLNHTNPLLDPHSDEAKAVRDAGYKVALKGQRIFL